MLHRDVLNYIDKLLRDIAPDSNSAKLPFGGKCIILGGDWKQALPVVKNGSAQDQINASIKMDPLFKLFGTLKLTINMRAEKDEKELCNWLHEVGNGNFIVSYH